MSVDRSSRRAEGEPARPALARVGTLAGAGLVSALLLAGLGAPDEPVLAALATLELLLTKTWPSLAYVLGAFGLGRAFAPLFRGARDPLLLQALLGLGLMLALSLAMGALALWSLALGRALAFVPIALGLALLSRQVWGARATLRAMPPPRLAWLAGAPALGALLAAACSPPGWLWRSEGGGYDVLSYHLHLPREWLELGRLVPLEHNVYSFLPGAVEAAFLHLLVLMGVDPSPRGGVLAGHAAIACQFLHALIGLVGVAALARASGRVLASTSDERGMTRPGPASAIPTLLGVATLSTPWIVVTASLAYNEMAVLALGVGAFAVALDGAFAPARRAALAALLVSFACLAKPTALMLVGLPVGVVLAWTIPPRAVLACVPGALLAGVLPLAPWLVRNAVACGSPVFPFAADLLGRAHWSPEQVGRFGVAHRLDASLLDRLAIAFGPFSEASRGPLHPQWGVFFLLALAGVGGVLASRGARVHRASIALALALLAALAAWLWTTHVQSRFLIPIVAPAGLLVARASSLRPRIGVPSLAVACAVQASLTLATFFREHEANPTGATPFGVPFLSGLDPAFDRPGLDAGAIATCNRALPRASRVYLLGGAPFYLACPTEYHTTYDASPLARAIVAHPDGPARWTEALRARGIDHVLVNSFDLERLRASTPAPGPEGWLDPALTRDALDRWLSTLEPVGAWPEAGQYLLRLPVAGADGDTP